MEEEEREAQSAKLQELIRRGTPEDLREANKLMKIMAGYDTRSKVDYRAKAAEEVAKIQQKAKLLEERLDNFQPGDKIVDGDVFSELAAALTSAQPKIQKMCEEESDDHEAVAKLLEINDSIHRTVERYKLLKKGDIEGAKRVAKGGPASTTGAGGKAASKEVSLIDLDDGDANGSSAAAQQPSQTAGVEDDLLGLSLGDSSSSTFGQTGGIALGYGANTSEHRRVVSVVRELTVPDIPGPALLSSLTQSNSAKGQVPTSASPGPFSNFSSLTSAPASKSATPQPPSKQAFSPPSQQQATATDPFAALASLSPTPPAAAPAQSAPPPANDDDEWNFASALPPEQPQLPKEHQVVVSNTGLRIDMAARRAGPSDPPIQLLFAFSNNAAQQLTELHFQLAVTKVCCHLSMWSCDDTVY
jgi:ADP-ribosylation factor-binding protein GGA